VSLRAEVSVEPRGGDLVNVACDNSFAIVGAIERTAAVVDAGVLSVFLRIHLKGTSAPDVLSGAASFAPSTAKLNQ